MLGVRRGVLRVAIGGRLVPPLPLPPACRLLAALHRSGLTRRVGLHLEAPAAPGRCRPGTHLLATPATTTTTTTTIASYSLLP
eukprot:scaffold56784_cov57-Phaeocystis_antarctica.AAC.1